MSGIGETLREARMRRRIDMAEVESATKIRAKYLRALENEEWSLLPGPTFVKTFLRTYADYLELDSRSLVEEYKQRFERPAHGEFAAFGGLAASRRRPPQRTRRRSRASLAPILVVAAGVVLVLVALYLLGIQGPSDETVTPDGAGPSASATPTATVTPQASPTGASTPTRVRLELVATGDVYVCLVDAAGKRLIDGATLHAGDRSPRFTGRRMLVSFGTSAVRMRINGKTYDVARSADPVGYELRPGRKPRRLSDAERPTCS
jgi:cytoskeleton protein RodZ